MNDTDKSGTERPADEWRQLQQSIETLRDVADSIRDDAPATAGFLDGVREDVREAKRMYRNECLRGRIQAEMVASCADANPGTDASCAGENGDTQRR